MAECEASQTAVNRRRFLKAAGLGLGALAGASLACGQGGGGSERPTQIPTEGAPVPASAATPVPTVASEAPSSAPLEAIPTRAQAVAARREITANDYVPEQRNIVETVMVLVNFSGLPERVFDLRAQWPKVFGQDDPIRQLNAYYRENFYGQLELQPFATPQMGERGYVEVELPGMPGDYTFGWLVGMETEEIQGVDPDAVQRLILDITALAVAEHPEIDFQNKFLFVVLNATGREYGRGAAGAVPTGGLEPLYDLFIGEQGAPGQSLFDDSTNYRLVGDGRVVGAITKSAYTFEDYFQERDAYLHCDQFILGMGLFGTDAPLSCASHDILHGLRRKSAYAEPPEGRSRAINCLYNLQLQSQWLIGTEEHGRFDRAINCTPYIGWWDPMADHLHPVLPRGFFSGHPNGMCAFTKLRMGLIPDRCQAVVEADDMNVNLAPLGNATLPAPGSQAEVMVVKVPLVAGYEELAHIYLLLEYRRRVGVAGQEHPDHFTIDPAEVLGDITHDPGYNASNPAQSRHVNPPTVFVPDEGVLVYLVNEGMPEIPGLPYTGWQNFVLALLNPEGNDKRDDLNQAALDAGEQMVIDFRDMYPDRGVPLTITVTVTSRTSELAQVRIVRQRL